MGPRERERIRRERIVRMRLSKGNIIVLRCWCGLEFGHDWLGKSDGRPHPRE